MVLVYVDDILCIHKDTSVIIDALESIYVMREGSMGPSYRYLGAKIERVQKQDGKVMWETHMKDHFKVAIVNLDKTITSDGKSLSQYEGGRCPYLQSFHTDIDTSTDIEENDVHEYQHHIGVLNQAIELGIINIITEVSCLSQNLCAPRVNHLGAAYKI